MAQVTTTGKSVDTVDAANQRLLRLDDISDRLAISRSMAWKLVAYGEIRSVRIGRAVRVRPADLDAYIESAERGA